MSIEKEKDLFEAIYNAVPIPIFRVTNEVEILDMNQAALLLFNTSLEKALRKRGGEIMRCIHAIGTPNGCGKEKPCQDCAIRNSVTATFNSGKGQTRVNTKAEVIDELKQVQEMNLMLTATPLYYKDELSVLLCIEDITELTALRSIIPICSNCKKIRDDSQLWNSVEGYFNKFHGVDFTHGICPDCARELYGDYYKNN